MNDFQKSVRQGIPEILPPPAKASGGVSHAPSRPDVLDNGGRRLAVANALRYFPEEWHPDLSREFAAELRDDGRIYMRRFRPSLHLGNLPAVSTLRT